MRAKQVRRLLVFAVCAVGVGALYLVPGVTTPPGQLRDTPQPDRRGAAAPATSEVVTSSPRPGRPGGVPTPRASTSVTDVSSTPADGADDPRSDPSTTRAPDGDSATQDPARGPVDDSSDRTRPEPVPRIAVAEVTRDSVTVRWSSARDNVGVVSYRVWLNGYPVATTSKLSATIDWFNDDTGQHVVQVRAYDAAGNESDGAQTILVDRPTADPSPSTTPTSEPSTEPTEEPSATATPAPPPPVASTPAAEPTDRPTGETKPESQPSDSHAPGDTE